MILDLIKLAMERELRDLRIDLLLDIDATAIDALNKLDFFQRAVLEAYAVDPDGNRHDVVIMTKRLHKDFGDY
jgi:DNA primase catalytic subunit